MNNARIGIGVSTWFLGIIVPVYHHVALHAALVNERTNNVPERIRWVFESLPWIDWVYLGAMAIVGAILVVSGLLSTLPRGAG